MKNKKAFTLIELMIVITIMVFMMMLTYAPYNYYQQKAKLKIASREISQSMYEWRNLAVSWVETKSWSVFSNKSIWVFLSSEAGKNHQVYFYTYPYNKSVDTLTKPNDLTSLLKTKKLQKDILIKGSWSLLFFYEAINWNVSAISFNEVWDSSSLTGSVDINLAFKDTTLDTLKRTLNYNLETNTVNYK